MDLSNRDIARLAQAAAARAAGMSPSTPGARAGPGADGTGPTPAPILASALAGVATDPPAPQGARNADTAPPAPLHREPGISSARFPSAAQAAREKKLQEHLRMFGSGPEGLVPPTIPSSVPPRNGEIDVGLWELNNKKNKDLKAKTPGLYYHQVTNMLYRLVGVVEKSRGCLVRLAPVNASEAGRDLAEDIDRLKSAQQANSIPVVNGKPDVNLILRTLPLVADDESDVFRQFGFFQRSACSILDLVIPHATQQEIDDHVAGLRGNYIVYKDVRDDGTIERKVIESANDIPVYDDLSHYSVDELVMIASSEEKEVFAKHHQVRGYANGEEVRLKRDLAKYPNLVLAMYAKFLLEYEDSLVSHSDETMIPAAGTHLVSTRARSRAHLGKDAAYLPQQRWIGGANICPIRLQDQAWPSRSAQSRCRRRQGRGRAPSLLRHLDRQRRRR